MTWVHLKAAAHAADVSEDRMREWARAGYVHARRLACGHGHWRVALGLDGLPVDGQQERRTRRAKRRRGGASGRAQRGRAVKRRKAR